MAAMALLASCDKDPKNPTNKGDVIIEIGVDPGGFTKGAIDDVTGEHIQNAVTVQGNLYIFLAAGENIVLGSSYDPTSSDPATLKTDRDGTKLTTAVNRVIVVGNLPTGVVFATDLQNLTTVTALQNALRKDLSLAQSDYLAGKIWVQGEASVSTYVLQDDGTEKATVSIQLAPVLSRIDMTVNLSGVTDGIFASGEALRLQRIAETNSTKGGVVIEGVSVLYSSKESTMVKDFTPVTSTGNVLYSDISWVGNTAWEAGERANADEYNNSVPEVGAQNFLSATWTDSSWNLANQNITGGAGAGVGLNVANYVELGGNATPVYKGTFTRSFYAFSPNNYETSDGSGTHFISPVVATEPPYYKAKTIVTVYGGKYNYLGVKESDIYWAMAFDPDETVDGTASDSEYLVPGYRYAVKFNFKGDFSNGGGGSTTPEEPKDFGAWLEITIQPAKWLGVVNIEKTWEPS